MKKNVNIHKDNGLEKLEQILQSAKQQTCLDYGKQEGSKSLVTLQ